MQAEVERLIGKGVPPGKIVLGLPFYGRRLGKPDQTLSYAEILRQRRPAATSDEVGGYSFNGPATIVRKTKFALERKLGGAMAWELGQDAAGGDALLAAIRKTVDAAAP